MIIQFAIRTFGPILLRGGLGGGAVSTSNTDTRTGDDDFDDFDDSSENEVSDNKDKVSISLPTFAPDTPANKTEAAPLTATVEAPARVDLFDSFDDDKSNESSSVR
jgi:hypothetical protein